MQQASSPAAVVADEHRTSALGHDVYSESDRDEAPIPSDNEKAKSNAQAVLDAQDKEIDAFFAAHDEATNVWVPEDGDEWLTNDGDRWTRHVYCEVDADHWTRRNRFGSQAVVAADQPAA